MRKYSGWIVAPLALAAIAFFAAGCDLEQAKQIVETITDPSTPAPPTTRISAPTVSAGDTIRIASFNIQVFGQSKLDKPKVVDVLTRVVRQFDVVAVQELRSKEQNVIPQFLETINADGGHYDAVVGERLGRTSSKEQYVFIYDAARIELDRRSVFTVDDPMDLLHREPLVATFRVRGPPTESTFSFTLVNIHTDPDEVAGELNALDDIFRSVQRTCGDDDVILLGDLNASAAKLRELGRVPNIRWTVNGEPTNTLGSESYDNILFDGVATREFTGQSGIVNLQSAFNLTQKEALEVSDHMPIWATFTAVEHRDGPIATAPSGPIR